MRRRTLIVLALTGSLACSTTTKYAMPPAPPGPADNCIASCQRGNKLALRKKDRTAIWDHECLAACPGIVVSEGECEEEEKAPRGFCVQKTEKNPVAEVVGGVILLGIAVATIVFAVSK